MTRVTLGAFVAVALTGLTADLKFADEKDSRVAFDRTVAPFFAKHCAACHDARKHQGDLNLTDLDPDMKASTSAGRWALLLQRVSAGEMPPEGRPRPDDDDVRQVVGWIRAELKRAGKNASRREAYANGNLVAHGPLFDPKNAMATPDVAARLRRPSPEIYAAFLADVAKAVPGVGNPFSPEGRTTFKDMDAPKIDEPVTSLLIRNAVAIVERTKSKEVDALLDDAKPLTDAGIAAAVQQQFGRVLGRKATTDELARFAKLMRTTAADAGRPRGVRYALAAVLLLPEAVFRWETAGGPADERGLVRLGGRPIAYAVAYALTDRRPDSALLAAADGGRLSTNDGVAAAVKRLLDENALPKPRVLRFFREYFGYAAALEVFKEMKDHPDHDARALVEDTDRLIEDVLARDKDVLAELLTTNRSYVAYKTASATKAKQAAATAKYQADKAKNPEKFKNKMPPKAGRRVYEVYGLSDFPERQPVELPKEQRAGVLTQPSWLVAMSTSDDNHAIHRGKWVRERLLGGVVPDIPITVDAQLPNAPHQTLRQRMAVTQQAYCSKCHQLMNDVGLTFETFDHLGRYRTAEKVLDEAATRMNVDKKGKPLGPVLRGVPADAAGLVALVGDERVEGKVTDAVAMLHRLARSERVEQVFVRHAFRYWMGRNETAGDAGTLQAAQRAYRDGGGSMKALIAALLTSESFLYRAAEGGRKETPGG